MIEVYTDGGSRGNPGHAAWGFVVKKEGKTIMSCGKYIGIATNNTAEYTALVEALLWLKTGFKGETINAKLDSNLVVSQLNGQFKVKNKDMKVFFDRIKGLEKEFVKITYNHIPRNLNQEADKEVNLALDKYLKTKK